MTIVTLDALVALQRQGYNILPGDLGENITLAAPEALLARGVQLCSGSLTLELVETTTPCKNLEHIASVVTLPDRQRRCFPRACRGRCWYARVLTEGELRVGDSLQLPPKRSSVEDNLLAGCLENRAPATSPPAMAQQARRWKRTSAGSEDAHLQVSNDKDVVSSQEAPHSQAVDSLLQIGRGPSRWRIRDKT